MQKKISAKFLVSMGVITCATTGTLVSACGNNWFNAGERKNSPSAKLLEAQKAFDLEEYDQAIDLYYQVLDKDSNNTEARVKIAYCLNAKAGIDLYSILQKKLIKDASTTPTPTAKLADTSGGLSGISDFTDIVGLTSAEKAASLKAVKDKQDADTTYNKNLATNIRASSYKLSTLHEMWKVICPILPAKSINDIAAGNEVLQKVLDVSVCKGGLPEGVSPNTGAIFAAVLGSVSQAAILYQLVIDQDADGQVDMVVNASALADNITKAQSDMSSANGETDILLKVEKLQTAMGAIITNLDKLTKLKADLTAETVKLTMAQFKLIIALIKQIPGIPEKVVETIDKSTSELTKVEEKLNKYLDASNNVGSNIATPTPAPGATIPPQGQEILANAEKANVAITDAITKQQTAIDSIPDPVKKVAAQKAFETQKTSACGNFDALKSAYNLPTTMQKPADCVGGATPTPTAVPTGLPSVTPTITATVTVTPTATVPFNLQNNSMNLNEAILELFKMSNTYIKQK